MLVMALCIAAFVLVTYFGKTFRIFKKNAFVYPSAAYIDQILPPVSPKPLNVFEFKVEI
jgi:hypothetical protein